MKHLKRLGVGFCYLGIFAVVVGGILGIVLAIIDHPKILYGLLPLIVLALAYSFGYESLK
jgi:hypothetical protein